MCAARVCVEHAYDIHTIITVQSRTLIKYSILNTQYSVRAGQGKRGKNYFRPLPSIESLRSKVFLKARTELFKVGLAPLATRLSSCTTNDG